MDDDPALSTRHVLAPWLGLVLALALASCGPGRIGTGPHVAPTTTTADSYRGEHGHEHVGGAARASERLDPTRRAALGLPPEGETPTGAGLPLLSAEQWRHPEVVAARFVLVDTNHLAGEDPATLRARRAAYAGARFAEDLARSSSAAAGLAELAARGAVFHGEIIGIAAVRQYDDEAVVAVSVRRSVALPGAPRQRPRVTFYRLTLVRDGERWLVVDVDVT